MVDLSTFPGVLLGILGRGVPLSYPNPDPISDQKMSLHPFSDLKEKKRSIRVYIYSYRYLMNSTVRHLSEHVDPKRQELVRSGKELK